MPTVPGGGQAQSPLPLCPLHWQVCCAQRACVQGQVTLRAQGHQEHHCLRKEPDLRVLLTPGSKTAHQPPYLGNFGE